MTTHRHLILGGYGFVGRHVAARLVAAGQRVTIAGRHPLGLDAELDMRGVRQLRLDLSDADWPVLLDDVDVVHHYAWSSILQSANVDPGGDLEAHVQPTLRLLDALRRHPGKRLVFLSSGGTVYGDHGHRRASEDDDTRAASVYAASKLAAEHYCRAYHRMGVVDACVVRLSNPYGVGQDTGRNQGLVSTFVRKALAGEPLSIWGDGSPIRDYVHVCDAADALALAAAPTAARPPEPLVLNVGSGEGASITMVIAILEDLLGRTLDVTRAPGRSFDLPYSVLDIARVSRLFPWRPRYDLRSGVAGMIKDLRDGRRLLSSWPGAGVGGEADSVAAPAVWPARG